MGPGAASALVGRNIRRHRVEQGMTQERLAELLTEAGMPVSDAAVSRMESGQRAITVEHLMALADVLDRSLLELLEPPVERAVVQARREAVDLELLRMLASLAGVTPQTRASLSRAAAVASANVIDLMERNVRPMLAEMARQGEARRPTPTEH